MGASFFSVLSACQFLVWFVCCIAFSECIIAFSGCMFTVLLFYVGTFPVATFFGGLLSSIQHVQACACVVVLFFWVHTSTCCQCLHPPLPSCVALSLGLLQALSHAALPLSGCILLSVLSVWLFLLLCCLWHCCFGVHLSGLHAVLFVLCVCFNCSLLQQSVAVFCAGLFPLSVHRFCM